MKMSYSKKYLQVCHKNKMSLMSLNRRIKFEMKVTIQFAVKYFLSVVNSLLLISIDSIISTVLHDHCFVVAWI